MFYLIKGIDKIKKDKTTPYLAFFGKAMVKPAETFRYSLLFLANDGKSTLNKKEVSSKINLKALYAIVPEMNPLLSLSAFSINDRMKWNQTYLPLLRQGVELMCKFDPRSSLYRQAWFHNASYWGVTPEILQRRSLFNDRYFLWTLEREDIEKGMNQLKDELKMSTSLLKFVFIQSSTSKEKELPPEYIKQLEALDAIIVNKIMLDNSSGAILNVGYDSVEIGTMDVNGQVKMHPITLPARTPFLKRP
jgi:hypothetical protein